MAGKREEKSIFPAKYRGIVLFARDAGIAILCVVCILLAMFAYTGLWPPLVVVESNSMMHSQDNTSYIGVIDTGDLVLVKKVDEVSDVRTYVDGIASGHRTYGDYGDVLIYERYGRDDYTPIIHRAIIYLEGNADGMSYRASSLRLIPSDKWSTSDPTDTWDHLTSTLTIYHVGYRDLSIVININQIIADADRRNSDLPNGFITKGDYNLQVDQASGGVVPFRPVELSWTVGKARGEIPWFGLLKLWFTGTLASEPPPNSVRNLWICMILIVTVPIVIDVVITYRIRRKIAQRRAQAQMEQQVIDPKRAPDSEQPPPEDLLDADSKGGKR